MKCAEFEQRFHNLLDHRISSDSDAQLNAHALDCPDCQQLLAGWSVVRDGLEFSEPPEFSDGFTSRVVDALVPTVSTHRGSQFSAVVAVVAVVAAVILVAVIPSFQSLISPEPLAPNTGTIVQRNEGVDQSGTGRDDTVDRVANDRLNARNDERESPGPLAAHTIELPQFPTFSDVSGRINSDEIPGVRPIRSSLTVAFTLMRRALPGGREESSAPAKPQAGIIRNMADLQVS